ncbi:hypothetical protein BTJ40_08940 [Microbulbifer sp. A4B17]|uniref:hypothetical protein n=1 Tax=Microbulbifer sp. A4B17 TaxID=359370 RepID=UPI000D52D1CD|nr:hypothetical protein [Microbulbifer sp. A4B17]AWF80925.1 hypothetical protein BTJ40_08940 [Microbulbifer sp. A4B17]
MSEDKTVSDSYLPSDFKEQLDKLISSQGTDIDLGKEVQESIMATCREVNDALTRSFSDLSSTGFELNGQLTKIGDENE